MMKTIFTSDLLVCSPDNLKWRFSWDAETGVWVITSPDHSLGYEGVTNEITDAKVTAKAVVEKSVLMI